MCLYSARLAQNICDRALLTHRIIQIYTSEIKRKIYDCEMYFWMLTFRCATPRLKGIPTTSTLATTGTNSPRVSRRAAYSASP